jgi:hypothetical protein
MPLRVQLRIVSDDDAVVRDEVILRIDKSDDRLEAIGLCPPASPPRREPGGAKWSRTVRVGPLEWPSTPSTPDRQPDRTGLAGHGHAVLPPNKSVTQRVALNEVQYLLLCPGEN